MARPRQKPIEILTPEEVGKLLRACGSCPTGTRDRALIALLWRCGLRVGEALALMLRDVDLMRGTVQVVKGKGGKHRVVGLDTGAQALLEAWLGSRKALPVGRSSPLFCTLGGTRVSTVQVRAMLKRRATRAGLEKRVHPHGLRHAFAVELATEGPPVPTISAALGHSSSSVTAIYLDHVQPAQVLEVARRRGGWLQG